jgi:hypothetical protein
VEVRWLDSKKAEEEKRAVDVRDVVYAAVQCVFDEVTVVSPVGNAVDVVHGVAVPHDVSVFVLDERLRSVQDHFYSRKIQALRARHL